MRKFVICSLASHDILSKGFLILTVRVGGSARWGHITYMEEDLAPTNILRVTKASGRSCE